MKKILVRIERFLLGRKKLQSFYSMLHRISLRGMYYNQSLSVSKSGEVFAMKFAEKKLNANRKIILDIGGNKGEWTKIALEIFSNASIYIFEPSSKLKNHLDNLFKNNRNVTFIAHGISDKKGLLKLYKSGELIGTSFPKKLENEYEEISVLTVDEFAEIIKLQRLII